MSVIGVITSLFRPQKKVEDNQEKMPPEKNVWMLSETDLYLNKHGFTSGIYKIKADEDRFIQYLEAANEREKIKIFLNQTEENLRSAKEKVFAKEEVYNTLLNTASDKTKNVAGTKAKIDELNSVSSDLLTKRDRLTKQRDETHPEHSWVASLLFLIAGVTFVVADISITHQITSWGFDMKGMEGWIFAIGLAFTAFLIKPLLDRLFEKPFQKNGFILKAGYTITLSFIAILGMTMLYLLGKFRSDSQIAATKIINISAQLSSLRNTPNSPEIRTLISERNAINDSLNNNAFGEWGIIFSGIVFAIGGALCFAVALPSFSKLITRYWILPFLIRGLESKIERLGSDLSKYQAGLAVANSEVSRDTDRLSEDLKLLKDEAAKLEAQVRIYLTLYYQKKYEMEVSLFLDGKMRGEKFVDEGDLHKKIENPALFYYQDCLASI